MEELKQQAKDAISASNIEDLQMITNKVCNEKCSTTTKELHQLLNESLYHAVTLSRYEIAQFLVLNGADVNYEDPLKQSVLLRAIISAKSEESDEILKFILQNGADINHKSVNGQTDFMFLMESNHLSYIYLASFLDLVSDINEINIRTGGNYFHMIFNRPSDENKTLIIEKLLDKGLDVNGTDNNGDSPLHLMAAIADCKSMKVLLESGANIHARNKSGESLLHTLASSNEFTGFQESLNFLIEMAIDINDTDSNGRTPLHHALMSKDTDEKAIEELLNQGIKVNVKDSFGRNELYYAVEQVNAKYSYPDLDRRAAVIKLLINTGVDINEGDINGITPLHLATTKNDLEILVTFLDGGADVTKKTNSGATALHWSCKIYNMAHVMIHWYLNEGRDIDVADNHGSTALHWAIWYRMPSTSQSLLQVGADYSIKDNSGNTPGDLAKKLHFTQFTDLVTNESYKDIEGLALQDLVIQCDGRDALNACPLLHYISKQEGELSVDEYIEHLKCHETPLAKCIKTALEIENMDLFYNIEENNSVPEIMFNLVHCLSKRVGEREPLFRCILKLSGSVYEETKVHLPNEFDYLWILEEFCEAFSPVESPEFPESFVKMKLKHGVDEARFGRYLNQGNFLDSRLLIRDFYRAINEEVTCLLGDAEQFHNIICLELLNEIFCTNSNLGFRYFGKEAKSFRISVDVIPTVSFQDYKPRELKAIDTGATDTAEPHPFNVIIKTPDRLHVKDFSLFFRISHAYLEQSVMREIPKAIKKGYILLKVLKESGYLPKVVDHDNKRAVKHFTTSYHLKTCFLHEVNAWRRHSPDSEKSLNEWPDSEEAKKTAMTWAIKIVERYEKSIQERFLPPFFELHRNLFGIYGKEDCMVDRDIFLGMVKLLKYLLKKG